MVLKAEAAIAIGEAKGRRRGGVCEVAGGELGRVMMASDG